MIKIDNLTALAEIAADMKAWNAEIDALAPTFSRLANLRGALIDRAVSAGIARRQANGMMPRPTWLPSAEPAAAPTEAPADDLDIIDILKRESKP